MKAWMGRWLGQKLLGILGGALVGYVLGWITGWLLFDPERDLWALGSLLGCLGGVVLGVTAWFQRHAGAWLGACAGLYLGWVLRTLLFGDTPGDPSVLVAALGLIGGVVVGSRPAFGPGTRGRSILAAALVAGLIGGFVLDVVLLDRVLGVVKEHSILEQAPWVLLCGVVGGLIAARWGAGSRIAPQGRPDGEMAK